MNRRSQAWAIVAGVAVLAAVPFALRVKQDDDVLAFLPAADPDVRAFHEVSDRFGALDVAIVGLEAPDVFAPDFLARLKTATSRLESTDGVAYVLSLANVEQLAPDPAGGVRVDYLITNPVGLRERALLRDDLVGNLVDKDGRATVIYCFAAHGADSRAMARRVAAVADAAFPGEARSYGGAPFIATYILDVTQRDLRRLGPWAALALAIIAMVALRSIAGALLVLVSTGIGIALTMGLMGALGVRSNLLLASMPIIVFALGSAYGLHVVARRRAALGPTLVGGLATAAAIASFLFMDVAPMRSFGLFTAVGLLVTLALAMTFVPAALALLDLPENAAPVAFLSRLAEFAKRNRIPVALGAAVVLALAVPAALRVDAHTDENAFFASGSPPARAHELLSHRFGGDTFIQVAVDGDFNQPAVLRALSELADRIAVLPNVSSVTHIGQVLEITNEAMSGDRTLPATPAQAQLLFGFLQGKKVVRQLISDDRAHALIQVKLAYDDPKALAAVRALPPPRGGRGAVIARITALCSRAGMVFDPARLDARLATEPFPIPRDRFAAALEAYLGSDEYTGDPPPAGAAAAAAAAAAAGPDATPDALAKLGLGDATRAIAEIWRRERAQAFARDIWIAEAVSSARDQQLVHSVGEALLALSGPGDVAPLHLTVTGQPVLHEVMARSVAHNQLVSLAFALLVVFLIAALRWRSPWAGLVTVAPAAVTIAVLYAGMALLHIRLDLGTSILASLVVGAGTGCAFQLQAAPAAAVGRAVATNALMVAAGFFVLTLGEAAPLRNVGGLTAAAMLLVAAATFLLVPALSRRSS